MRILSGVFTDEASGEQVTTGTPIALEIENVDARSKDYGDIKDKFRPGHADYTYLRQIRRARLARLGPGERARRPRAAWRPAPLPAKSCRACACAARWCRSGRMPSTAAPGIGRRSSAIRSSAPTPRPRSCGPISSTRCARDGSSCGAIIEIVAEGVPAGLGAPIYGKLDQDIASGLMSINAVKGVEIGAGFAAAALSGEENADEMRIGRDGAPEFLSNNAGGILGGISTGQPIVARFAVKPTSSILTPRRTVDAAGNETEISTKGRHDPCVGIRAVPIGEAMLAIVLADHYLRHRGQTGKG